MAVDQAAGSEVKPEEQWPAVALAYEFVRPSYDIMLKRFEIVEGRIRALLTLTASLTFGAPVFATAALGTMPFTSLSLQLALTCAAYVLVAGCLASVGRRVDVPNPGLLHDAAMRVPVWDFQRVALQAASDAWQGNRRRLEWKAILGDTMAVALLLELGLMVLWVLYR